MAARRAWRLGLALLGLVLVALVVDALRPRRPPPGPRPEPFAADAAAFLTSIPPDTLPVAWRDWSPETFAEARRRAVPVAVLLDAGWSESCILYAGALAAHAGAHAALERLVLPVRVDAGRRPDVQSRYGVEITTLPLWILLTPEGRLWDLRDALPPARLAGLLGEMQAGTAGLRADPGLDLLRAAQPVAPAGADLGALPGRLFDELMEVWPAAPESLPPDLAFLDRDALGFVRDWAAHSGSAAAGALYRDTLRRIVTSPHFDAEPGSLLQSVETSPDRVGAGRFLHTHAALLEHLAVAAAAGGDARLESAAAGVTRFLATTLWDERAGLFAVAQGTLTLHDGRPALTSAERARLGTHAGAMPAPHVVPIFPSAANARASAALRLRPAADRARGRAVLERLRELRRQHGGRVAHDAVWLDGRLVISAHDGLGDWAELGLALLAWWDTTREPGLLAEARDLGAALMRRFGGGPRGLFYDAPAADRHEPERMHVRLTPLPDNARAALFLLRLGAATGDAAPRQAALAALEAWSGSLASCSAWDTALLGTSILAALPLP
jgi:hypothetical protein